MKNLFCLSLMLFACLAAHAQRDTIPVYFATGDARISKGMEEGLVNYLYNDVLHTGQQLQIVGYADYVGAGKGNDALSKARAAAVKRFLVSYGYTAMDITVCIGKGEVARENVSGNEGFARDRRVDIVIAPASRPDPIAVALPALQPAPVVAKPQPAPPKKTPPQDLTALTTIREQETIQLKRLYFYPGRHIVRPESVGELKKLEQILEQYPTMKIGIEGHICCTDPEQGDALDYDTHEIALSVNRAKEVYSFLVRKGIDEDRLSFKGFGATRKLVEEHNEDDANTNRRVEIRVLAR